MWKRSFASHSFILFSWTVALLIGTELSLCRWGFIVLIILSVVLQFLTGWKRVLPLWVGIGWLLGPGIPSSVFPQKENFFIAEIADIPRYPQVGEVSLSLYLKSEPFNHERWLCKGAHLPWRNIAYLKKGETVSFTVAKFYPIAWSPPFTYSGMLLRRGFKATCSIQFISRPADEYPVTIVEKIRKELYDHFGEKEEVGMLLSLVLGTRDMLSLNTNEAFQKAGLSHLLVFSGYQLVLISGAAKKFLTTCALFFYSFISSLQLRRSLPFLSLLTLLPVVLLTGAEQSTLRAYVALSIFACTDSFGWYLSRNGVFFLVIFFLQLLTPSGLFEPSLQLSLAAVWSLSLPQQGTSTVWNALRRQFVCSMSTSFLTFLWFGNFSLISIPMNLLCAFPLSMLGLVGGSGGWALWKVGIDVNGYLLKGVVFLLHEFTWMLRWIASYPYVSITCESLLFRYALCGGFAGLLMVRRIMWQNKSSSSRTA